MYLRVIPAVKAASFITLLIHQRRLLLLQTLSYSDSLSLWITWRRCRLLLSMLSSRQGCLIQGSFRSRLTNPTSLITQLKWERVASFISTLEIYNWSWPVLPSKTIDWTQSHWIRMQGYFILTQSLFLASKYPSALSSLSRLLLRHLELKMITIQYSTRDQSMPLLSRSLILSSPKTNSSPN
jgi:hypothetical protein